MPAEITREPLGIACVFSDGTSARFVLDGLPCPELAEDLLTGLAELIHPHGTVDSAGFVEHYAAAVRHMTRHLAAAGFTGGAAGLRRAQAARYWMAAPGPKEACTRRMLHGFQTAGGTLDARLAELAAGRSFNPQRNHRQLPPYSETEWERLARACEAVAGESFAAHKKALAAAGRGRHPRENGWSEENLRWLLARTGPVGIVAFGEHLGCSDNVVRQRGGVLEASRDLFPGLDTVIACRLLFGIYSGIVPDGIDDLVTGDIDWAGDSVILLSYVKGRTAAESLNLPRQAVRLLEQWLAHSALLRSHAGPEHRRDLWLRLPAAGPSYAVLAEIAYQRDDLDVALRHVTEGIALCRQFVYTPPLANCLATLAMIRQATGDPAGALEAVTEAGQASPGPAGLLNPVPVLRARVLLAQGDVAAAARFAQENSLGPDDEPDYARESGHLVLARVLLAQDRPGQALALLDRLHETASGHDRAGSVIEIGALRAVALAATGDEAGAVTALAGALTLACPQGYVRVFADEGPPMAALLGRLIAAQRTGQAAAGVPLGYLARLQRAFDTGPSTPDHRSGTAAVQGIVDPLTSRELEVLTMLAGGRSNQAIARELVVTLDTVKKHVSHVLGKLGAANRTEAVARTRQLALIP